MNWQQYKVDIELLRKNKENLLRFSNSLNESAIRILYTNHRNDHGDWKMADHMVERFRSFNNDPAAFYSGTPGEQRLLSYGCNLNMKQSDAYFVMEFFKYVRYVGAYYIGVISNEEYIKIWEISNSIDFFFILPEEMQLKLLEQYNIKFDQM